METEINNLLNTTDIIIILVVGLLITVALIAAVRRNNLKVNVKKVKKQKNFKQREAAFCFLTNENDHRI
jgi:hypothetical protein